MRALFAPLAMAAGLLAACHSSDGGGGGGGGEQADVFVPEAAALCPADSPLACDGGCLPQDKTHCASCTDVCGAAQDCRFGQCICKGTQMACNGVCIDTTADPKHCGACTHDCHGGACSAGLCVPTTLAPAQSPWGLATNGVDLFWTNHLAGSAGSVMRVPVGGGTPSVVASAQSAPRDIAVDGQRVFWLNDVGGAWQLMAADASGANLKQLYAGSGSPAGLGVAEGGVVAWATNDPTVGDGVYSNDSGDAGVPFITGGGNGSILGGFAADSNFLFWGDALPTINQYDRFTKLGTVLGVPSAPAVTFAADATYLYFTLSGASDSVATMPRGGGSVTVLATGITAPAGIAVSGADVFFTNLSTTSTNGGVWTVPIAGGKAVALAANQPLPTSIVADANNIYWTNNGTPGAVMKLAR